MLPSSEKKVIAHTRARAMASRNLRFAVTSLLMTAILLIIAPGASAYVVQQSSDDEITGMITLSPTIVELEVAPGQVLDREMVIVNRTGRSLSVDFLTEDFEGSNDPAMPVVLLGTKESPRGARTWLQPEVENLTINQGESVLLNVRIRVPGDAAPGGYYGMFLASFNTPMAGPDGTGMNVVSRAGCYFLLKVAGPVDELGSLDPPMVDRLMFSGPVPIGLRFNNECMMHLRPSGMIRVKNLFGMTVAEIPVTAWTVLPHISRNTDVSWDRELLFGRYTVEATIDYGGESSELVSQSSFWAFSWIILLALLILIIIAVLIFLWLRKRRKEAAAAAEADSWDELIREGLEVSRALIAAGKTGEARQMLQDLRSNAHNLGLYREVVIIDDLLLSF